MTNSRGQLSGLLVTHVDDFLYGGNRDFLAAVEKFQHKVKVGTQERANFKFCGMNLKTNGKGEIEITVAGDKQDLIKPIPRVTGRRGRDITDIEETMVRSRIGALQ